MRRKLIAIAGAVALAGPLGAATPTFQEVEEQLGWNYQGLMNLLSPAGRSQLRQAEREWIDRRNRACGFEAKNDCAMQWARRRSEELQARLDRIWTDPQVVRAGHCFSTSVQRVTTRLEDGDGHEVPDSGSAVEYADGHYMVDYAVVRAVTRWRKGDPIRLCVTQLPRHCPRGDVRGVFYRATNLRTRTRWDAPDSEHRCGGA